MKQIPRVMVCLAGLALPLMSQSPSPERWSQVQFLLGEWRGAIKGEQGNGSVTRRFRLILSGEYLQERSVYNFPPQPLHPNGSVFTLASVLVSDQTRPLKLYRQFEQDYRNGAFVLSKTLSQPNKLVFEMEPPAGAAVTWKARETWEVISPNSFVEIVEVAQDGKSFSVQSRIQFDRRLP